MVIQTNHLVQAPRRHSRHEPLPFNLRAVRRKKFTLDFNGGNQSYDAGLLLLREQSAGSACWRLAAAMPDRRDPDCVQHEIFEMSPLAPWPSPGIKDAIDRDRLRRDPKRVASGSWARAPVRVGARQHPDQLIDLWAAASRQEVRRQAAAAPVRG